MRKATKRRVCTYTFKNRAELLYIADDRRHSCTYRMFCITCFVHYDYRSKTIKSYLFSTPFLRPTCEDYEFDARFMEFLKGFVID